MTEYTVTVTIKDRAGQGPAVLCEISPPPNPSDRSQAVALWLVLRDRAYQFNKEHRNAVTQEKALQEKAAKKPALHHGGDRPRTARKVRRVRR